MVKLTWNQAAAWRLHRQHLVQRAPVSSLLTVVSNLCGLHAQVMSSAELTVWARVEGLDRRAVQRALWEDRTLVKTWAMRGTLHLLPTGELPMWRAALSTSRRYLNEALWQKHFDISLEELDRLTEAIGTALDSRLLTRVELMEEVARLTGSAKLATTLGESSWGTILKPAAFAGHLCFGPSLGQRVRFTRPNTWLKAKSNPMDLKAAISAITRRFLSAYGPATYRDLARWWGGRAGIANAREWIAALDEEVSQVQLGDGTAWMLAQHVQEARELSLKRSVQLLPGFDQYVITASHHTEQLLPGDLRSRVYRPQGWISPVLLVNGRMLGTWAHSIKGSRVEVVVEPFGTLPPWVKRAAGLEAERLATFLGCTLNLAWKT